MDKEEEKGTHDKEVSEAMKKRESDFEELQINARKAATDELKKESSGTKNKGRHPKVRLSLLRHKVPK